jgi:hypothetical protein
MTIAELIASGRATISVEEASEIWGVGRCTGYEIAVCTFGAVRCGRKLRVPVPRLLRAMGIPLPDGWQPAGSTAPRCQCHESEPTSVESITSGPKADAEDSHGDAA